MTQEQHPITPPDELVEKWTQTDEDERFEHFYKRVCTQAARWGADMELDACCEWLDEVGPSAIPLWGNDLRKDRRPKPPSLKEQAQRILVENGTTLDGRMELDPDDIAIIRRALEALPG